METINIKFDEKQLEEVVEKVTEKLKKDKSEFRNNLENTSKVHELCIAFACCFQYNKEDIDEYQIKSRCSRYCRCLERIDYG